MPCALVSEHLAGVAQLYREFFKGLAAGGRLVFSAFHPDMAGFGIEANFERNGAEYRLGALCYTGEPRIPINRRFATASKPLLKSSRRRSGWKSTPYR